MSEGNGVSEVSEVTEVSELIEVSDVNGVFVVTLVTEEYLESFVSEVTWAVHKIS